MQDHIHNAAIFLFGILAGLIGTLFDVPAPTLWVAAIGSALGVAFSKQASFKEAFCLIMIGTLATGWAVPFFLKLAPGFAQKSVAALISFLLIGFRVQIKDELPKLVVAAFARLYQVIKGN